MAIELVATQQQQFTNSSARGFRQVAQTLTVATVVPTLNATGLAAQVLIPMNRGQIFHPIAITGEVINNAANGASAGQLLGVVVNFDDPISQNVVARLLASFTTINMVGGAVATWQAIELIDVSPLDLVSAGVPVITPNLRVSAVAQVNNTTAGSLSYQNQNIVLYETLFISQ